ncbi:aminopeptidase N [Rhodoligotrophos appendicifer]|uniref:aminopeptidase N n=1 Tax=Rhodoligotrophos appendicifer TaxID=987056 RepID=UPI00118509E4|nr:aminopeptidase N [Rhodoligotrophos appendicifer]
MEDATRTETPPTTRLVDYRPSAYLIDTVFLDLRLAPRETIVRSRLEMRPNPAVPASGASLTLDGEALTLRSLHLDGAALDAHAYTVTGEHLTLHQAPVRPFVLEIETSCDPEANTELSGLYRSNGIYCTQCEAEGFRRITYYLDRPDVLAVFTTRIEGARDETPILLGNGNPKESGRAANGHHFAIWHDPFPKPCYLFAMVAGDLACVDDRFTTASGRDVALRIYVEPGKEDRCGWAMDSLKRSMRWDEEAFGREYDLDIFMIVAVSDFNMGAMENKGLNVFNDKYVLARPDTATDADYANIESIIAHEYFHNWTGNRITCRDWFQLCLKEGLTVFRDQEFTTDIRSGTVKRIADVRLLRTQQFPEDAGPLAHPVRPEKYIEINNFYTATVYEKGAELVRMMRSLIGRRAFRAAMDLYFERHDGEAATIEQFLRCMEDASGRELGSFLRWYNQAGTPLVTVTTAYDAPSQTLELRAEQTTPPTPGQPSKAPLIIPIAFALVGSKGDLPVTNADGTPAPEILELTQASQVWRLHEVTERPVLSINRGFSAPIRLNASLSDADRLFLMGHDSDAFNRWEAGQIYAKALLVKLTRALVEGRRLWEDPAYSEALRSSLLDDRLSPALRAELLTLPTEGDLASEIGTSIEPDAIHLARRHLSAYIGRSLRDELRQAYHRHAVPGPYSPDPASAGNRALRACALTLLAAADAASGAQLAWAQFAAAENMTETFSALATLARLDRPERDAALEQFYERAKSDPLLVDKWLALQAVGPFPSTLDRVRTLMGHPEFSLKKPNKVRALIGSFAALNPVAFNDRSGRGYVLLADLLLALDPVNPQVAARLAGNFKSWRMLEPNRQALARRQIERVRAGDSLSRDLVEIVGTILA